MDVTSHLRTALDAAIALANGFGAAWTRGRARVSGDREHDRETASSALLLATWRVPSIEDRALDGVAEVGAALYRALGELAGGDEDAAAATVNGLLRRADAAPTLTRHGDEPWHLHFAAPGADPVLAWLADLVTAVAMLLGSTEVTRLRGCAAQRCDRFFLDATRGRTQRFCSTACQNRTKVAAFRARSRADER
ncbi:CGNR zinc finger domain-containing protein [Amycolatopsis minnesotensis]|uniref:Zinc finger CGNR domain-containing protein n=1 Tax=Amycolatopsis minnesotensis TaxID=337894 RepID=A0ABP5C0B2_9PSEU